MPRAIRNDESPFGRAVEGLVGAKNHGEKRLGSPTVEQGQRAWVAPFLDGLAEGLCISDACKAAGIHPTLVYTRRRKDQEFRMQWNEAAHIGTALLEQEAQRRAYHGTERPVFHKGVQVGTYRDYSDTMLSLLLKARKPDVYREKGDGGHGGTTINFFERVAILQEQLEHGGPAIVGAGVPQGAVPGQRGRERLDTPHTNGQANGVPAGG